MVKPGETLFSCNYCDKSYNIKASFYSHMRIKHPNQKKPNQEDGKEYNKEDGDKSIKIVNIEAAAKDVFWYENEEEDETSRSVSPPPKFPPPTVSTQELENLLPRAESRDSMLSQFYEAERFMEVRDLQPEWFNTSFDSVYAENLRRNSMTLKCNNCDKNLIEMNKMRKHVDDITVKTNIFFKKTEAQKKLMRREIKKLSDQVNEEKECRQCPMRASVEEDQAKALESKDKEVEELKNKLRMMKERNLAILVDQKKMKREKRDLEKKEKTHANDLKELRDINSEIIKNNATQKIEMKRKDDLIKGLKELSGIDETDDVDTEEETVNMDNETSGSVCLTCNKTFPIKRALEQHMQAKHIQSECPICDEVFPRGEALERHTEECMASMDDGHQCPYCKNKLLTKKLLKSHVAKNHKNKGDKHTCSICEAVFKNENELTRHTLNCQQEEGHSQSNKSNEVCRHWRRGNCKKGDACGFSHVGYQIKENQEFQSTKSTRFTPACKHGQSCKWFAKGTCSYFHKNVGVQKPWSQNNVNTNNHPLNSQGGYRRSQEVNTHNHPLTSKGGRQESGRTECRYGALCHKVPNCTFLHSLSDFPTLQMGNQHQRTQQKYNRRH